MRTCNAIALFATCALAGCTSIDGVDKALKGPVAGAASAKLVASAAEDDSLRAIALGAIGGKPATKDPRQAHEVAGIICTPFRGPDAVTQDLGAFADYLAVLDAAAAKPKDTSYTGYILAFKTDEANLSKDPSEARKKEQAAREAAQARCSALATADLQARLLQKPPSPTGAVAEIRAAGAVLEAIVAGIEALKREEAVREIAKRMVPLLRQASAGLKSVPGPAFGPSVDYAELHDAPVANSVLAASINLHRWWTARLIFADWDALAACRKDGSCGFERHKVGYADAIVANAASYRALAAVDPAKILQQLDEGIDKVDKAANATSTKDLIDALLQLGDTLSTINDKYKALEKARAQG